MREITVRVHEIATDGLPDMESGGLTGRVALIFDGCIVSGWPLNSVGYPGEWEGDTDVSHGRRFGGVTHWIELLEPAWNLERTVQGGPREWHTIAFCKLTDKRIWRRWVDGIR